MPLLTVIDIYLSVPLLAKDHAKTSCPIHPIESRYLMGTWRGMYRNIEETMLHFLFEEFYTKESSRGQKGPKVHIFKIFVYTYLSRPSIVVCAFFHYKNL